MYASLIQLSAKEQPTRLGDKAHAMAVERHIYMQSLDLLFFQSIAIIKSALKLSTTLQQLLVILSGTGYKGSHHKKGGLVVCLTTKQNRC